MAAHLAPVEEETVVRRFRRWTENNAAAVVWAGGSLVENMIAVLERRLIEQAMRGLIDKPLTGPAPARLHARAARPEPHTLARAGRLSARSHTR